MKKREKIFLIVLGVLVVICLTVFFLFKNEKDDFDITNGYIFVTDTALKTMLKDGGSHTDIYYEVDLKNNKVTKKQDEYKAFEGKVSEEILKTYVINESDNKKINEIFDKIIEDKDKKIDYFKSNYEYYVLKTSDGLEIKTNNYDLINEFESIFK